jgi:hypothetical protein
MTASHSVSNPHPARSRLGAGGSSSPGDLAARLAGAPVHPGVQGARLPPDGRVAAETGGGLHFERLYRDYAWYARLTVPVR